MTTGASATGVMLSVWGAAALVALSASVAWNATVRLVPGSWLVELKVIERSAAWYGARVA